MCNLSQLPLQVLKQLYDTDILTEDALLAWADEKADAAAEDRRFLTLVRALRRSGCNSCSTSCAVGVILKHEFCARRGSRHVCLIRRSPGVFDIMEVALPWLQAAPLIDWLRTADESEEESDDED
jgi:eIF4-gamma/eIF5/eIF2-epsilon